MQFARISYWPEAACLGLFFAEASRDLVFPQMFSSAAIIAFGGDSTAARLILMLAASSIAGRGGRGLASASWGGVNEASPAGDSLLVSQQRLVNARTAAKKRGSTGLQSQRWRGAVS